MCKLTCKIAAVIVALTVSVGVYAAEYNFYDRAKERGCASIITDGGGADCKAIQRAKDDACNVAIDCDADKQQRAIEKYNELKQRLKDNQVPDADRAKLQETIDKAKADLDDRRDRGTRGISVAEGCVSARENVQKWFMEVGIPLTEHVRDDALLLRKKLLANLADAQRDQADAASKRAANPRDSTIQANYERATQAMRDAEKSLEEFNNKYSKDIEYYASRLIDSYKLAKTEHEKPLDEAKNRRDNCKKVAGMSY